MAGGRIPVGNYYELFVGCYLGAWLSNLEFTKGAERLCKDVTGMDIFQSAELHIDLITDFPKYVYTTQFLGLWIREKF